MVKYDKIGQFRNIIRDYKNYFKEQPGKIATVIIMNDADDTQEESVSWVNFIKVSSEISPFSKS